MCGIAGIFHYRSEPPPESALRATLCRMLDAQVHRGPDDWGTHVEGPAAIGMRRLSIIDRAGGHQPLANESHDVWVVFNGEIYNYRELHARLRERHTLRSSGDTETLVHLYEERGARLVDDLNGMFAFAIWDPCERRLLLARDRLGIKPLYWAERDGALWFASELPALIAGLGARPAIDEAALDLYLALGYIPSPHTIYRGIRSLPAAHVLEVDRAGPRLSEYWRLDYSAAPERPEAEWIDEIQERLRAAVRSQLVSEVPLGAFLSGGLDSTALVALMSEELGEPVKTFSLGFEENGFDELAEARAVARRYGTEHTERTVRAVDVPDAIERGVRAMGQPFGAWSLALNDLVAGLARERVTVAIAGHGGDEIFGGYPTLTAHKLMERYQRLPRFVRRFTERCVGWLPASDGNLAFEERARLFLRGADLPYEQAFLAWKRVLAPADRAELLRARGGDLARDLYAEHAAWAAAPDRLSRLLHIDTKLFLEGSCLAAGDRTSMAHSLEVRVPFLDHTLVEFAASMPAALKHRGSTTKYILRRALERWLPEEIVRRKKTGFVLPENRWLRGELREYMLDELATLGGWELLGEGASERVRTLVHAHLSGRANHGRVLTTLISLAIWRRQAMADRKSMPSRGLSVRVPEGAE